MPVGCRVNVEREDSSVVKDEYALLCKVPQDLDEETKGTIMTSKSKRKEYRVSEVMGENNWPGAILPQQDVHPAVTRRQSEVCLWVSFLFVLQFMQSFAL